MGDSSSIEEPVKLPTAELVKVDDHISLLPPLSRRGHGPGLILILPQEAPSYPQGGVVCENGIPPPLLKWAEEGFAVVEIREGAFTTTAAAQEVFAEATAALESCEPCRDENGIGLIGKSQLLSRSIDGLLRQGAENVQSTEHHRGRNIFTTSLSTRGSKRLSSMATQQTNRPPLHPYRVSTT